MPVFSHFALQKALYQQLTDDAPLMALITDVYDNVPENAGFPYVIIGDMAGADWSSKTTCGMDFSVNIYVFSREGGRKETSEIMEHVYQLLHEADLDVEDQALVMLRFVSSVITRESDGRTCRGMLRFKALLQAL
jgi:hypothetical protein